MLASRHDRALGRRDVADPRQNNVQGASDMGAIPFVYTDYQRSANGVRARFCQGVGVVPSRLSAQEGPDG